MHPFVYRPEYDQTELEEIAARMVQSVKLPVSQICLGCVAEALEHILDMPVCFDGGCLVDAIKIREAIEDGVFDEFPRVIESYHNAEAYLGYLMDLVNVGVDDLWLYADECYKGCPICAVQRQYAAVDSLMDNEAPKPSLEDLQGNLGDPDEV